MREQHQIKWLLNAATSVFSSFSDSAKLDAELLLCHVLDCSRTYLFTWPEKALSEAQLIEFYALIKRRELGEPIAHITGSRDFWTLSLNVNPSTLIPRPDTETLVEAALDFALAGKKSAGKGLDLGTGTGAIALALASELPNWEWLGLDYSKDAVSLAQSNGQRNDISNVQFKQSNWFSALAEEKFDLIVSNPPYIDKEDPHLTQGDVVFEPLSALVAEKHGLADIEEITSQAKDFLNPNGALMFEHGYDQAQAVQQLLQAHGFCNIKSIKDLGLNDRVTVGYLP